jgi:hypothetical protein
MLWSGKQATLFNAPFPMGGVLLSVKKAPTANGVEIFLTIFTINICKKFRISI